MCARVSLEGSCVERAALRVYEDPRIREVEHGYSALTEQIQEQQRIHGRFFYRFQGGESPADCYDRVSSFLESMMRQVERHRTENVLIVSHGLSIRCFVMRFLRKQKRAHLKNASLLKMCRFDGGTV